jgi:antitoxin ChpS
METNLRNFGNSVGLVIPKPVREALHLRAGQTVTIEQTAQGGLLVSPRRKHYSLEELLAQCDADAPMPQEVVEWESLPPVGEEVW